MKFTPLSLSGAYTIDLDLRGDSRGWFARTFCKKEFEAIGHSAEWVQMNHSYTANKGTIRGLHFQVPPFAEVKMIRCISGKVFDVMVDLRRNSPSFLKWEAVEISKDNHRMVYIPEGFAHGFQALTDDCELLYQHTAYYNPSAESGIRYDDPLVGVNWPIPVSEISERDKGHELLNESFKGI